MVWTVVATNTSIWSESSTGFASEYHPLGSPVGLLLTLTYPTAGDAIWTQDSDNVTVWTEI